MAFPSNLPLTIQTKDQMHSFKQQRNNDAPYKLWIDIHHVRIVRKQNWQTKNYIIILLLLCESKRNMSLWVFNYIKINLDVVAKYRYCLHHEVQLYFNIWIQK